MTSTSEQKHDIILDSAFYLFSTKGFYETKIAEIAEHAGVAKGTVYLYFSSKEELFKEMTRRNFDEFLDGLSNELTRSSSFAEKLNKIADHHLSYFYNMRNHTRIFFQGLNNDPEFMEVMFHHIENYVNLVTNVMESESINESKLHAKAFVGMLENYKMDILFTKSFTKDHLNQRVDFAVKLFMNGCKR
ncbi:TetR/AcrR family transcriptional regulator [Chengkuizengella axinellae]|uniref:TetR/AcrR family transcriptional regulator n=1 Tax=Chengkuizengella axinellae TaxID=3064388 RepID=A0ABT9ITM0_9BACL|nr:TetR/AcrR family transcriptional regulator [Chengkuizengella sp. 2205SS18-9]MDP5272689.1 TetR/AcrR family transcriptional regulator [Chengkuizengella sp. 2205SS18-9]